MSWGDGRISVENPFVSYSAPLGKVRLVGRAGKGGALGVEGIGEVPPWALSRSVFDGKRANEARREMRHAVLRAVEGETGQESGEVVRRIRFGWMDLLLVPILSAWFWAFLLP